MMMDRPVKLTEYNEVVLESGRIIRGNGGEELIVTLEDFAEVGLSALARLWSRSHEVRAPKGETVHPELDDVTNMRYNDLEELLISLVSPDEFDRKWSPASHVSIVFTPAGRLAVRTLSTVSGPTSPADVARLIQPQAALIGGQVLRVEVISGSRDSSCDIRIEFPARGKVVRDAFNFGNRVSGLISALGGANLSPFTAWGLLQGGHGDALVGQMESSWLDVKSAAYNLDSLSDKVELAQDVARFANAEQGGLLIIGMRTKRVSREEIISGLTRTTIDTRTPRRYRDIIDKRVFPPIDDLRVELFTTGSDIKLIGMYVPPQQEENKPFLVHGAIVNGRYEGGFISIVRRRGEDSIPISGPAIHSTLAAGRALLRGRSEM
ncbi:AlbA family DNA-binding domain-containing protein [Pseudonocardia sp. CA-142604]|uniref:AlbA family DNA-binding domain-containing protein n=1 Tax=Pseudonocardia sp. CA-142604 TaxID=3240024 RepID=UPI003D8EF139